MEARFNNPGQGSIAQEMAIQLQNKSGFSSEEAVLAGKSTCFYALGTRCLAAITIAAVSWLEKEV
jgi:hypothetical protein